MPFHINPDGGPERDPHPNGYYVVLFAAVVGLLCGAAGVAFGYYVAGVMR